MLELPEDLRRELKDPMGPIETDAEVLLRDVSGPLYAVGDVVTYHFLRAGREPDVALVDGITKREAVDEAVRRAVTAGEVRDATNPPATITADLARALRRAIDADEPVTLFVDGEEDLAVLPAIAAAPDGASVVYGQPDEGMVHVRVDGEVRASVRDLLERFEGDSDRLFSLLDR
ncbi:GTP-dependent dephospho-CoA kinase family protein [Halovivax sp.]|uniref:GTP-dependent dephospho-CoA kinase family protein n=1 Tax=Halovivax sp. TaxID=1935978 RepID=UPI0025C313C9|nr:GTP-dependent dephospho-CoA kinase family protein [Halovivax sp.]